MQHSTSQAGIACLMHVTLQIHYACWMSAIAQLVLVHIRRCIRPVGSLPCSKAQHTILPHPLMSQHVPASSHAAAKLLHFQGF